MPKKIRVRLAFYHGQQFDSGFETKIGIDSLRELSEEQFSEIWDIIQESIVPIYSKGKQLQNEYVIKRPEKWK